MEYAFSEVRNLVCGGSKLLYGKGVALALFICPLRVVA